MFKTHPMSLSDLLRKVDDTDIQLPDFQRGWVWEDDRIRGLLASISRGFPIGAVMMLDSGGDIRFKCRPVEGATDDSANGPEHFLLDGQQRLTSLYQALLHPGPVDTHDARGRQVRRWYYVDMTKALDPSADREDAIVSVPENRIVTSDFGRRIDLDLSSPEKEFENHMAPTEQLMEPMNWMLKYLEYWKSNEDRHPNGNALQLWSKFNDIVIKNFASYSLPVITLDKETSKEAVCLVFEKVNTGGVSLTTFELVTATFAADDFSLRDDWKSRRDELHKKYDVLRYIEGEQFLQATTLLTRSERRRNALRNGVPQEQAPAISCRRRDLLDLTLKEYKDWADKVQYGFIEAAKFLHAQFVFTKYDVSYNSQLVSLAALYAEMEHELLPANAKKRLERWYWSGIFGEQYGGPTETLLANDFMDVPPYIREEMEPRLISEANFIPERLISLRTKNSAAYKGLYALLMKNGAADWRTGKPLSLQAWHEESVDIHHIFPIAWCTSKERAIPWKIYQSIINKTPIDAHTNRMIGGNAPSRYLARLDRDMEDLDDVLRAHWLDSELLRADRFADSFVERGQAMLELIAAAMGKEAANGRAVFRNAVASTGYRDDFDDEGDDYDAVGEAAYAEMDSAGDTAAPV